MRTVTLTIYKIEADLVDSTTFGKPTRSEYVLSRILVSASGEGHHHERILPTGERCWIGDTYQLATEGDR